jgi:hypothetical protein
MVSDMLNVKVSAILRGVPVPMAAEPKVHTLGHDLLHHTVALIGDEDVPAPVHCHANWVAIVHQMTLIGPAYPLC